MPWKEPGKGDKDPWKSDGQQPPDLEEIFGNVSKRLQSLFGVVAETPVPQVERAVVAMAPEVLLHWCSC